MEFPTIRTENLLLRQFEPSDLGKVFEGLSNPDVIKYYGISFDSLDTARAQMEWFSDLEKNGTGLWWAICSPDNEVFYGAGGLNNLSKEHKKAEVGFWLLPEHWGQGIMKNAMPLICNYGFDILGLHRIEGFVDSENEKCKRTIVKLGFVHEGTMRDCEIKDGRFVSLDIYANIE